MYRKSLIGLSIIAIIVFIACKHQPNAVPQTTPTHHDSTVVIPTNTDSSMTETVDTTVCFERDVLPVFTGSCGKSGCHDFNTKASGYVLTTYATIIAKGLTPGNSGASKVYTKCVSGSMPKSPTPKLTSTQLYYIKRWIDLGAHNDTGCVVNCDTTKYTYNTAIVPIMQKYCYSCHATAAASSSGGNIILDTYAGMLTQAQNGRLLGDLNHQTGYNNMPLGGLKLSDCKITQVRRWIQAGAPNN